jgi:hypothetical protein
MPGRQDDEVARRSGGGTGRGSVGRSLALAGALALAVAATAAAFLTDDARYLRLAVLAAVWAFVAAALVAGRFRSDEHAATGREQELRRAYERELDLEAAARREFEADLESDLRRRAEEALRREVGVLRRDLAELARVRGEFVQVGELRAGLAALADVRADLAGLTALRADVAALSALRGDVAALRSEVAALGALPTGLDQLAELRSEVGRLRAELAERLSGGMLVERIVMRTDRAILDAEELPAHARSRHAAAGPALAPPPVPAEPIWAALTEPASPPADPPTAETPVERPRPVPYRRRRTDDTGEQRVVDPAQALTTEHRFAAPAVAPGTRGPATDGHVRVAEILAENGLSANAVPRRRRRYREADEPDDVLARVLGTPR